jgi:hypothetical protein
VPEPSKTAGFSFARSSGSTTISRNSSSISSHKTPSSTASIKRSRPSSAVYNRSKTVDLTDLSPRPGTRVKTINRPLLTPTVR